MASNAGISKVSKKAQKKELVFACELRKGDRPSYHFENEQVSLRISGSFAFVGSPVFIARKSKSRSGGKRNVASQALDWIEAHPAPDYYWQDAKTEDLVTDHVSELIYRMFVNNIESNKAANVMSYLNNKVFDKFTSRAQANDSAAPLTGSFVENIAKVPFGAFAMGNFDGNTNLLSTMIENLATIKANEMVAAQSDPLLELTRDFIEREKHKKDKTKMDLLQSIVSDEVPWDISVGKMAELGTSEDRMEE